MRHLIPALLLFVLLANIQAQELPNIMSPDVASLGRFGTYPVSYYTGTPDISIPLYSLICDETEIPISLRYDASGLIPSKDAGIAGQNWTLVSGGVITRTVNGMPDEKKVQFRYGYLYGIRQVAKPLTADEIRSLDYYDLWDGILKLNLRYEHTPDMFTFNFNGHTGKFLIDNTGDVKVISDRPYKVDISGLKLHEDGEKIDTSYITITDELGYRYIFGGAVDALEIEIPLKVETSPRDPRPVPESGTVNAWHLSRIISPNRDVVSFRYQKTNLDFLSMPRDTTFFQKTFYYAELLKGCVYTKTKTACDYVSNDQDIKMSLVKLAYLQEIETPHSKAVFHYSRKEKTLFGSEAFYRWKRPTLKLDKIQVLSTHDQNVIKDISLKYQYYPCGNDGYRMFLETVTDNMQKYTFDYYQKTSLPSPITKEIDLWGYYNRSGSRNLLPQVDIDKDDFPVDMSHRRSDTTYCSYGLLSRITHPAGGSTLFQYEGHDYSTVIRKTGASGNPAPEIIHETGYTGGARIRAIKNQPGESRYFYYKGDYTPQSNGKSSGILLDYNVFCAKVQYPFNSDHGDVLAYHVSGNNIAPAATIYEPHIGYSEVTEVVGDHAGGYTSYYYSNHLTNPDRYDVEYRLSSSQARNEEAFKKLMRRLIRYSSCAAERGNLIKQVFFDSGNDTVRSMRFTYNNDPNRFQEAVYTYNFPYSQAKYGICNIYAIYGYSNFLTEKEIKEYSPDKPVVYTEKYVYNNNRQLSRKSVRQSNDNFIEEQYKYPPDVGKELDHMISKHVVGPVTDKTILSREKMIDSESRQYKEFYPGLFRISRTYRLETLIPVDSRQDHTPLMKPVASYLYNQKGKIISYQPTGMNRILYQWGYNDLHPVARMENSMAGESGESIICTDSIHMDRPGNIIIDHAGGDLKVTYYGKESATLIITGPDGNIRSNVSLSNKQVHEVSLDKARYTLSFNFSRNYSVCLRYHFTVTGIRNDFFYNGFEDKGSALMPFAGIGCNTGNYKVPYIKPDSRNYMVDYRKWDGIRWEYKKETYTDNMALNGVAIDEVRVYPDDAMIFTYTYLPLVGMTSETGPSGWTVFYEYDIWGRIQQVKDESGSMIKDYQYNTVIK